MRNAVANSGQYNHEYSLSSNPLVPLRISLSNLSRTLSFVFLAINRSALTSLYIANLRHW